MALPPSSRIQILAPVVRARKGEYSKVFADARKSGYARVRVDGSMYELTETITLDKNKKHDIEIVIDRLVIKPDIQQRLTDSTEIASGLSGGLIIIDIGPGERELLFSQNYACDDCGISIEELTPRMFSFNNPYGSCQKCMGLGSHLKVDPGRVIPDMSLSLRAGAVVASGWNGLDYSSIARMYFNGLAKRYGFSLDTPVRDLPDEAFDALMYGTKGVKLDLPYIKANGQTAVHRHPFEGLVPNLERRYRDTQSDGSRQHIEEMMSPVPCPDCGGKRLKKESLSVTVGGLDISEYTFKSVNDALAFWDTAEFTAQEKLIADRILKEIRERLGFLRAVGLEYLTLSRQSGSLSGGESQRIRLATQIGSSLMGVLYILDEPSIGLHQRDNKKLLATLRRLRDLGNTLLVVEHDEETMLAADHIVDVGPGAGVRGGEIVASGTLEDIKNCPSSITGQYLCGKQSVPIPSERRKGSGHHITIRGARENNLKNIDVSIPLGCQTCVTGVSGSGKSSLVNHILHKALASALNRARTRPGDHDGIEGVDKLDKVIDIDQSPIGRTPRSNPATYTGLFTDIRDIFAATPDAKIRGYGPGRFSFNTRGGRCEACAGDGLLKIEMHFLPDIYIPCDVCKGKRYNRETLEVRYKTKNIHEVLDMTCDEALEFFAAIPRIQRKIQTLCEVGLGYIKLGQPSTTLSGGEAQRVKLATELSKRSTGSTIYILDEPTTGLHIADTHRLIEVLGRLVEGGNTVLVIEHNLEVIKTSDWIIDLGPEGGDAGGEIVAQGTPEEVAGCGESYTGYFLKEALCK
jgi:excinuclease ABC subunit A